jgi:hypothetical protein
MEILLYKKLIFSFSGVLGKNPDISSFNEIFEAKKPKTKIKEELVLK